MNRFYTLLLASILGCHLTTATADTKVVTNPDYATGSTIVLGRISITGATSIAEQGLCYGTSIDPTVDDGKSTAFLSNNGRIIKITGLTPATCYYIRGYVKENSGAITYGESVKVYTLPGGNVTYGLRDGWPDNTTQTRVDNAVKKAVDYWNEYTTINGLYLNVGYGSETPTADCSYGGWMRIGPSTSYQATGTVLHEALHAVGVGTHERWYGPNAYQRETGSSGQWLGVRATRMVRFLEGDNTATLRGDGTHMWPYGINGAHEDNGTDLLYTGNSLLIQALCEDGLIPTSGGCLPGYTFQQDDSTKYYIKNESEEAGLYTSYLRLVSGGSLRWVEMSNAEAIANDSAAWYITYNPSTCYYYLRNVATGRYMTYSRSGVNGFTTRNTTNPANNDRFHFLPSHTAAITAGDYTLTGYWLLRPESSASPYSLTANTNGTVSAISMKFSDENPMQRWLILSADDISEMEDAMMSYATSNLNTLLDNISSLVSVPHVEKVAGADAAVTAAVESIKQRIEGATAQEIEALATEAVQAMTTFLEGVAPASAAQPFDLTFFVENGGMDALDGWSGSPSLNYSCAEFYQSTFDFNQTVTGIPSGTYKVCAQGFQRPGTSSATYTAYIGGEDNVTTYLYAGSNSVKIDNIMTGARRTKLGGAESTVGTSTYIPNDMQSASLYFAAGEYENEVLATVADGASELTFGLRCETSSSYYWSIFDNFRLYYFGSMTEDEVTGIKGIAIDEAQPESVRRSGVYSLTGVRVADDTKSLNSLPEGLYIVNGKKIMLR